MVFSVRFMFQVNATAVLANGLVYLLAPQLLAHVFPSFVEAPQLLGDTFCGAIQVAFGICGWLGLMSGEYAKYKSVLLMQCIYKVIFLFSVAFHYTFVPDKFADEPTPFEWFVLGIFIFVAIGNGVALWNDKAVAGKMKKLV